VLIVPSHERLATAAVFRKADELGLPRSAADLAGRLRAVETAVRDLPDELMVNDLEPAAVALCPAVGEALDAVRAAGARHALLCGSGPTVAGLFDSVEAARGAALRLGGRDPRPIAVEPYRKEHAA
jgi:4-diphosphocytidyl-2-C-methyl-D-erythritol kinase